MNGPAGSPRCGFPPRGWRSASAPNSSRTGCCEARVCHRWTRCKRGWKKPPVQVIVIRCLQEDVDVFRSRAFKSLKKLAQSLKARIFTIVGGGNALDGPAVLRGGNRHNSREHNQTAGKQFTHWVTPRFEFGPGSGRDGGGQPIWEWHTRTRACALVKEPAYSEIVSLCALTISSTT